MCVYEAIDTCTHTHSPFNYTGTPSLLLEEVKTPLCEEEPLGTLEGPTLMLPYKGFASEVWDKGLHSLAGSPTSLI